MLTLLLPTHGRLEFVLRLLDYLRANMPASPLVIMDDSPAGEMPEREARIAAYAGTIPLTHVRMDRVGLVEKIAAGFAHVETPYVVLAADDDFHVPSALREATSFLASHDDYAIAHGTAALFTLRDDAAYGPVEDLWEYPQSAREEPSAAARFRAHFAAYNTTWYSLQRTEDARSHWELAASIKADVYFAELLTSALSVIKGRSRKLDELFLVRQQLVRKSYAAARPSQWMRRPEWPRQLDAVLGVLGDALAAAEGINQAEGRAIAATVFDGHFARQRGRFGDLIPPGARRLISANTFTRRIARRFPGRGSALDARLTLGALLAPASPHYEAFRPIQMMMAGSTRQASTGAVD